MERMRPRWRAGAIWLLVLVLTVSLAGPVTAQTVEVTLANPADTGIQDVLLQAVIAAEVKGPVQLRLLRMTLQPGARSPWHAHPGLEFGVVEAGTIRLQVEGPAVLRAADAAPDAESMPVPENLDISLSVGDRIAYAPGTEMTFENPGTEPAVLLAATVFPADVPAATFPGAPPAEAELNGIESIVLGQGVVAGVPAASVVVLERLDVAAGENVPAFAGPVLVSLESGAVAGTVQAAAVSAPGDSTVTESDEVDFSLNRGQSAFFNNGMSAAPLGGDGTIELLRLGIVPGAAAGSEPAAAGTATAPATGDQGTAPATIGSANSPASTLAPATTPSTDPTAAPNIIGATIGPAAETPAAESPAAEPPLAETPAAAPTQSSGRPLFVTPTVTAAPAAPATAEPTQRALRTITSAPTPTPTPAATDDAAATSDDDAAADGANAGRNRDRQRANDGSNDNASSDEGADDDAGLYPAVGSILIVNDTDVRIRAEPGTSGEILAGLTTGQRVVVLDLPEAADGIIWYPVQVADDPNLAGWVAAQFLNVPAQ